MGIVENNIFFLGIDAERHMNDPVLRVHPLRAGSEDHQIVPGPYLHLREDKFALFPAVVGQGIALQVNGFIRGVMQLDPVGVISLVVRERAVILGHHLGDDQAVRGRAARRAGGKNQRYEKQQGRRQNPAFIDHGFTLPRFFDIPSLYQSRGPGTRCLGKFYNPLANVKKMRQPAAGRELPQGIYARPSRRAPFATSRQTSMPMTVGTAKETAVHLRLWVSL